MTEAMKPLMDFEGWGKAVAEEVLFRAGLDMSDAAARADAVTASLLFEVKAVEAEGSLELAFEPIAGSPVTIRIPL